MCMVGDESWSETSSPIGYTVIAATNDQLILNKSPKNNYIHSLHRTPWQNTDVHNCSMQRLKLGIGILKEQCVVYVPQSPGRTPGSWGSPVWWRPVGQHGLPGSLSWHLHMQTFVSEPCRCRQDIQTDRQKDRTRCGLISNTGGLV